MKILENILFWVDKFGVLISFGIGIIIAAGLIKWGKKLKESIKTLFSDPAAFIFGLIVVGLLVYLFFTVIKPGIAGVIS